MTKDEIIKFTRNKDYLLKKSLGQGATGKTVLLKDEMIDELFVCKKYVPYASEYREQLYKNFVQEIKLLHLLYHNNVVRVFNHYLYPEQYAGYIIMEYIDGNDIETYFEVHPENINEIFIQAIEGFTYLEECNILHRDIRPLNILVKKDGTLKIIDFGFGKRIVYPEDFDKSISLNLWCDPPNEFNDRKYNFVTEIYFVGKLFEKIIKEKSIESFKYTKLLSHMCNKDSTKRIPKFIDIKKEILSDRFIEIEFTREERVTYQEFSNLLASIINKIDYSAKYYQDTDAIQNKIESLYKAVMLEECLPDNAKIIRCFVDGAFNYKAKVKISVYTIRSFLLLLRKSPKEKRNIILINIHSKLDSISRYELKPFDDNIPF